MDLYKLGSEGPTFQRLSSIFIIRKSWIRFIKIQQWLNFFKKKIDQIRFKDQPELFLNINIVRKEYFKFLAYKCSSWHLVLFLLDPICPTLKSSFFRFDAFYVFLSPPQVRDFNKMKKVREGLLTNFHAKSLSDLLWELSSSSLDIPQWQLQHYTDHYPI
jgi:hypothetical protein